MHGLSCVGGSDSHYVSTVGKCVTRFNQTITRVDDLVEQLYLGDFGPAELADTKAL